MKSRHYLLLFLIAIQSHWIIAAPKLIVQSTNPDPNTLASLSVWHRPEDDHGVYVTIDYPSIPNSATDAFCFEGGSRFSSASAIADGALELRYDVTNHPHVTMITTVTPEAGAVVFVSRYEADPGQTISSGLFSSGMCNICYKPNSKAGIAPPVGSLFYYGTSASGKYPDYVRRCYFFSRDDGGTTATMSLGDTERFPHPTIMDPEDYRNHPWPWIQVYIGEWQPKPNPGHEGWCSTDKYTKTVIWCESVNKQYLLALASDSAEFQFQGWGCLHNLPQWLPLDGSPEERTWTMKVYLMENDPNALLERTTKDFPGLADQPYASAPATSE